MATVYQNLERKFVRVNATADGDNTVITNSDVDKAIVVFGYALNVNAAGVITVQDSAGTPVVHASFELVDGGGVSYAGSSDTPAFVLAKGTNLEISNAAGVDTLGHITYALLGSVR